MIECDLTQLALAKTEDDAVIGCVVVVQLVLGADGVQELCCSGRSFDPQVLVVLVIAVCLALLHYVAHHRLLLHYLVLYQSQNCHLQAQFLGDHAWNHDARCIHQKHQGIVQYFESGQSSCRPHRGGSLGRSTFILQVGNAADLIDDGRLAHIGSTASHQPQTHLFVLMPVIFLQIAKDLSHIVVFLRTDGKTGDAVVIVILDDAIGLDSVTEVVFVEYDQLFLLTTFDYEVEFGVPATVWNTSVTNLHEDVHFMRALFDQSKRLLHVSWKPVYVVLQVLYHVHSIPDYLIQQGQKRVIKANQVIKLFFILRSLRNQKWPNSPL